MPSCFVPDSAAFQQTLTLRWLRELVPGSCWGTVPTVGSRAGQRMLHGVASIWMPSDIATCVLVSMLLNYTLVVMTCKAPKLDPTAV